MDDNTSFPPDMWRKIMRYHLEHEKNPDKYPEWRNTWEWSEFMQFLKDWITAWFGGDDSIGGQFILFWLNNPILCFIIAVAFVGFAYRLISYTLKIAERGIM